MSRETDAFINDVVNRLASGAEFITDGSKAYVLFGLHQGDEAKLIAIGAMKRGPFNVLNSADPLPAPNFRDVQSETLR